jgi:predicted HTH transcriptional regulator
VRGGTVDSIQGLLARGRVQVFPSPTRPHYLTRAGLHGGTYVRVGSTNRRADDALVSEMQRFAQGEAFDERAMPELDSAAIDFRVAL